MAIKYRRNLNRDLTPDEVDENFETVDLYKGTYPNLAALQIVYPSPNDADYAYSTDGAYRFYALGGTWRSEKLTVSYEADAQYLTITDMIDAQSTQVDQDVYEVVDASSDPNVSSRDNFTAHYLYIGGTTETLSDYQLQPQAQSSVDAPFNDYGSLNEMLTSQGDQIKNYAYYVENDSKVYVYKGLATGSTADYAVLGGEEYKQSYLNAGVTLIAATSGTDYICRPTTPITVTIDAAQLASKHRNYFDNPSDQDITFASASGTTIEDSNGLVLAAGGTAYLYREFDTNIVHLKIS